MTNKTSFLATSMLLFGQAVAFSPCALHRAAKVSVPTKIFSAMERLHNPSTNAFGPLEHIYSLAEIDDITHKIQDDEWMALGSAIAESMLEMILDVGSGPLKRMGWVEKMSITNRIAENVSKTVKVSNFSVKHYLCYEHVSSDLLYCISEISLYY
jgi:hypothetical protein